LGTSERNLGDGVDWCTLTVVAKIVLTVVGACLMVVVLMILASVMVRTIAMIEQYTSRHETSFGSTGEQKSLPAETSEQKSR
jgi:hypothetical protein